MPSLSELQRIINQLPKLTPAERNQLRQVLAFLDGGKSAKPLPSKSTDDWLLPGLAHEVKRRGGSHPPLNDTTLNKLAPGYVADSLRVCRHLKDGLPVTIKHEQLLAMGRVVARALADYLQNAGVPIGLKVMLNNVAKMSEAIEQSFPGYLEAGWLGYLINA